MASSETRRRVSYAQLEVLWEFLNSHRDIALGYNKTAQARSLSRRMWETVAQSLNSMGEGATKNWKGWSAYWVDLKAKLKKKVAAIRASQARTGGGPSESPSLNEIEKKFLQILGDDFGLGLPDIQVNPFPELLPQPAQESGNTPMPHNEELILPPRQIEINIPQLELDGPVEVRTPLLPVPESQDRAGEPTNTGQTTPAVVRRRRRPRNSYSQEITRQLLVESSQRRTQISEQNNINLLGILNVMTRMLEILERLDSRFNATFAGD